MINKFALQNLNVDYIVIIYLIKMKSKKLEELILTFGGRFLPMQVERFIFSIL